MGRAASALVHDRWLSGRYVAGNKPTRIVRVRRGVLDRTYQPFEKLDGTTEDFGEVLGSKHRGEPWQTFWRPTGGWIDVPNVSDVSMEHSFENKGVTTATIEIENVVAKFILGVAGMYHQIQRGYLAPWFGWATFGRPPSGQTRNEWWEVFNGGYQVKVWEGYGDAVEETFVGLIDESKVRASPDSITLVARNFGQALTDQRVFGHNKAAELRSPIVFMPRKNVDDVEPVGGSAKASSSDTGNPPRHVTIKGTETFWLSQGHSSPDVTEWVQVRVPAGRYTSVFIDPHYEGMEMYLSIFTRGKLGQVKVNGNVEDPERFLSFGLGTVPGEHGGHPYVRKWTNVPKKGKSYSLGFTLETGNDTVFRVSFRKLGFSPVKRDYRAGCSRVAPMKRTIKSALKDKEIIVVDDASDMVKWALMWAGFHEWEVESVGVNIKEPVTFTQDKFLIDIVDYVQQQGDFVFYIDRPSTHPDSIGVPVFRRNSVFFGAAPRMLEVKDTQLLTDIEGAFTKEPLAFIYRARGRMVKAGETGTTLGGDRTKRFQASYLPPWSGAHHNVLTGEYDKNYPFANRMAGLLKHVVHYDDALESVEECMMACILICVKAALAAFTVVFEIPGRPDVMLDDQISVVDTGTGLNSRVWVGSVQSSHTSEEGYKTTVAGSLIDSPDILGLVFDYLALLDRVRGSVEV
jgi:hypothetical protein